MEYTQLGRSGLAVSRLCLGTMNFGPETTEPDSHEIMDRAHEHSINFFDTAKMVNGAVVSASLLHPARSAAECHPRRSEGLPGLQGPPGRIILSTTKPASDVREGGLQSLSQARRA